VIVGHLMHLALERVFGNVRRRAWSIGGPIRAKEIDGSSSARTEPFPWRRDGVQIAGSEAEGRLLAKTCTGSSEGESEKPTRGKVRGAGFEQTKRLAEKKSNPLGFPSLNLRSENNGVLHPVFGHRMIRRRCCCESPFR